MPYVERSCLDSCSFSMKRPRARSSVFVERNLFFPGVILFRAKANFMASHRVGKFLIVLRGKGDSRWATLPSRTWAGGSRRVDFRHIADGLLQQRLPFPDLSHDGVHTLPIVGDPAVSYIVTKPGGNRIVGI